MAGAMAPEGIQDAARGAVPRAVLLDALGTLISFEPPAPRLRLALRERLGADAARVRVTKPAVKPGVVSVTSSRP
jgi:hypothetical protein